MHAQPRLSGKRDTIVLTIAASTDVAIEPAAAALDDLVVDALDVSAYRVPTEMPEADGTMQWDATTVVVVEPRIRNGARGLGYSYGHAAMVDLIKGTLERHVLGKDVRETTAAWESMVRSVRNLGRPGLCSMAIAAVDIALHDTKARCLGQPLHRLLGGMRDEVPIYGSGGFTSYTERQLIDQLSGWVERGIPRVKMKIGMDWGRSWRRDVERIGRVRDAIGDEPELFVDANGGYDLGQAMRLGEQFVEEFRVTWFEEPVSSDDLRGLSLLANALPLDVSAGEYGYDLAYFSQMMRSGAVDVLQADASRCAGITEWLRAAALAAGESRPFSAHCGPSLHVHAATVPPNLVHIEYFHDHVRVDHLLFDGVLEPVGGVLRPSERLGLGLDLRRSDAERYRVA